MDYEKDPDYVLVMIDLNISDILLEKFVCQLLGNKERRGEKKIKIMSITIP